MLSSDPPRDLGAQAEEIRDHIDDLSTGKIENLSDPEEHPHRREVATTYPGGDHGCRLVETIREPPLRPTSPLEPTCEVRSEGVGSRHDSLVVHYECTSRQEHFAEAIASAPDPYDDGDVPGRRKSGSVWIDDKWRQDVDDELRRRAMNYRGLCKAIKAPFSSISLLMKRTGQLRAVRGSAWALDVAEFLGIPLPVKLPDWRGALLSQLDELRRVSEPDFLDAYDDLQADVTRRLARANARLLQFHGTNAVVPPHGGRSHGGPEPESAPEKPSKPSRRRNSRR